MDYDKGAYFDFGGKSVELMWSCEKRIWRYGPLSLLYEELWMNTQEKCSMKKNNESGV
jgi:hypothetical protein